MKSITVRKLMELLEEDADPDALVVFSSDYGDHGHTEQALRIRGDIEDVTLTRSGYSDSGWAIDRDGDDPDGPKVVLVS